MIDKSKPVLVTGANGYVASWLVKLLLEDGVTVHAAVRDPKDTKIIAHLIKVAEQSKGDIKFFSSDLLKKGSYREAMEGCEVVFHTASPFTTNIKDPQKELVDPAVLGTTNVLEEANKVSTVKRVVVTSSCAAIYSDCLDVANAPNGTLSEDVWNTSASLEYQPYSYSKTLAEKKAWEIYQQQDRWELVTINPSLIIGPALNPENTTSESFHIFKQMADGTFRFGIPAMGVGVVDVRDVAKAHFLAGLNDKASGRYILSAHNSNFLEVARILNKKYGKDYPIPKHGLPKSILFLVGPVLNKSITRKFVKNNVNMVWRADNSKSRHQLGIAYRPLEETLYESFEVLRKNKLI